MRKFSATLLSISLLLSLPLLGCFAQITGGVDKVVAQADRSDPVRAAVADTLATVEQNFAPILREALSEEEQAAMVEDWLGFGAMSNSMSSMDMLRVAENAAASARHISIDMPGADPIYWEQEIVTGGVQGTQRFVSWRFPVAFSNRKDVAADLASRIAPLFAVDPKWMLSQNSDIKLNPILANTTFITYLSMSMDGSSESVMVSIDYWHDQKDHEAMKGVRVYVSKMSNRTS